MKIGDIDVVPVAKATFKDFKEDDVQGLAAEVAYNVLFSIVPLLIFLTSLTAFVSSAVGIDDTMDNITAWLFDNLRGAQATALRDPIENAISTQSGALLSFGAVLALWGGKNAVAALMKALNVAFDVKETRPWWKKTAIALALTIALGLAVIAASAFFLAGSFIGEWVADQAGLGNVWVTVWAVLRWPLIAVLLAVALAFFYWAGPNVDAPFAWLTPGAVLAVVLWGIATALLGTYFRFAGGYVEAYGALGGLLAFVFWLYLMSLILLLGGELNSVIALSYDPQTQADAADPAKAGSEAGTKRSRAGGKDRESESASGTAGPAPASGPAATATGPLLGAWRPWPSAEGEAREALAAEGSAGRRRRFRSAMLGLGAAAVSAVSGAFLGSRRR